MKKPVIVAYLCFFATAIVYGQSKPKNTIGLSLGWQNFRMLDKHASPLQYGTNSLFPSLGLSYAHQNNRSRYEIKVSATNGTMNATRFGARNFKTKWSATDSFQYQISSAFINANIEATYQRKLSSLSDSKVQYWVGGKLSESAYYGDEVANFPWLLNTLDVGPSFEVEYSPFTKHQIGFKVDLAAIGVVTRTVYALFPKSNKDKNVPAYLKQGTRLASVDKFQRINFQLGYQYQVTKHFIVGADYRLKWMNYSHPKSLRALDKHFDVKFAFTY
ncbi:MAG TPA: hypothetical protein VD794_06660 [Flavisolibacter sp.]|nr:hypothetical protein [Flavisolibacter sp.]